MMIRRNLISGSLLQQVLVIAVVRMLMAVDKNGHKDGTGTKSYTFAYGFTPSLSNNVRDGTDYNHQVSLSSTSNTKISKATTFVRQSSPSEQGEVSKEKSAIAVTGEQLEMMLQDFEQPLVVDAFAIWCEPCLLMAPEFEEAAKELKGKVRFPKLDTDKEENNMTARLNIMGLPTLLFLDKYSPPVVEDGDKATESAAAAAKASAVLKGCIEGAMRKQNIIDLCEHYFFGGPEPIL
jgi:thiol-disulfide isomerase/thioredoxin